MEFWNQIGTWVLVFCLILQPCCVFTYEVKWTTKLDNLLKAEAPYLKAEGANLHLFGIHIMLMVYTFGHGIVLCVFFWMVRRYMKPQEQMTLVMANVFRTPSYPALLCVMVGNGVQILGLAMVSLVFAFLRFISPVSRPTLIMGMLLFSMIPSVAAGYVAVQLWITFNQKEWISIALKTTCFFSFSFSMLTFLHFILWGIPSSISFIVIPTLVWFCISVPLTLVGGYFGAKAPFVQIPIQTGADPRNIPDQVDPRHKDWAWWWKSFFAPGSFAIFCFFIVYSVFGIKSLSDLIFATGIVILWLGYSLFIVLAIMLASGTVGFFSSFWFVHHLYDAYMLEQNKSQDGSKMT